jgi:hypothetical protein
LCKDMVLDMELKFQLENAAKNIRDNGLLIQTRKFIYVAIHRFLFQAKDLYN